jgi:CRISPR-associated endonuclease/helicase Cas3
MEAFFQSAFKQLTGHKPFRWQCRLFERMVGGDIPACCDLPTGLGKTSVMTIWLIARACNPQLPRRLVYVVDRRAVVDQASAEAEKLRRGLKESPELAPLARTLGGDDADGLPLSTLRGQYLDNRRWLKDPTRPAIVVGTVDMIGSRLLFSGYGLSPRARSYQAGLLGADTLVVLDEAHLCPPFERLLQAIDRDEGSEFGPRKDGADLVPRFRLLSLSATGRNDGADGDDAFGLAPEDHTDLVVSRRLTAAKRLSLATLNEAKKLVPELVKRALALATDGGTHRVLIYCHSREIALQVKAQIDGRFKEGEHASGLLVGARRVHERQCLADWLEKHGFVGGTTGAPERPTFLVATSAGEVGVDLDADHLVCDLVEWERMVQRLGRVNRRGGKTARVEVIAAPRDREKPEDWMQRLAKERAPLELLRTGEDGCRDASPAALVALKTRAADPQVRQRLEAARTAEPLRPALTRAVVDAWSLTSLEEHTGRPDVQPWLRGWRKEEEPQTTVAWRRFLPWREGARGPLPDDVRRFFDAAPVHLSEQLETETRLAFQALTARAVAVLAAIGKAKAAGEPHEPKEDDPALVVLGRERKLEGTLTIRELAQRAEPKSEQQKGALAEWTGRTIVASAVLGGLDNDGMLAEACDKVPTALDHRWGDALLKRIGYRVVGPNESDPDSKLWKLVLSLPMAPRDADEEEKQRRLRVFVARAEGTDNAGDPAIARRSQALQVHHDWAAEEAERIADALPLPQPYREMLVAAARHHDAGKARPHWQNAMNAPREGGPYAKTEGGGDPRRLNGYRHEFGSLHDLEGGDLLATLDDDMRELALHLIAAHHGHGRPIIAAYDPGRPGAWDARGAQEARARKVALRFARLQRHYGPWGLAWLEALLRAADWRASARLDALAERAERPAEAAD